MRKMGASLPGLDKDLLCTIARAGSGCGADIGSELLESVFGVEGHATEGTNGVRGVLKAGECWVGWVHGCAGRRCAHVHGGILHRWMVLLEMVGMLEGVVLLGMLLLLLVVGLVDEDVVVVLGL